MESVICPHCKAHRIVTAKIPKDVVIVVPCPACQELSVLFRNKVIPLNRHIIEHGSFEERKTHLASVIAEFLDETFFPSPENAEQPERKTPRRRPPRREPSLPADRHDLPITEEELERFVRIELKCIDNPSYFKKHFG